MKKFLLIFMLSIFATTPALADRGYGRGYGGGGRWGWGGAWIVPAVIGGAILYEATRPHYVYAEPVPVYVQPGQVYGPAYGPTVAAPPQPWYFCPGVNGYYPYVRECPTGWQVVPLTPPGAIASGPHGAPPPPPPR